SFDQLVCAAGQRQWDGDAKRLGGLEVYEQLDLGRPLDRQITRLLSFENFPDIDADQTVVVRFTGSVAHQATGRDELAILEDRGHGGGERECGKLVVPGKEE